MLSNARRMPGRRQPIRNSRANRSVLSPKKRNGGSGGSLALPSTVLGFFLVAWLGVGLLFHFGYLTPTTNLTSTLRGASVDGKQHQQEYVPAHVVPRDDSHSEIAGNAHQVVEEQVAAAVKRTAAPLRHLDDTELSMLKTYAQGEALSVRRLKQSGTVKWGNGHDNRIWLMKVDGMNEEVIFKLNDLDMLFTDPSGNYDPKAPYYINNEYALLSWVTEFVAFALDRALGINMVPATAIREFTHEQFLSLFREQVQPTLDLKQALETDPLQRTGMYRYTPSWYDGHKIGGAMVEVLQGATRITDTVCSTFCADENIATDSRGIRVCIVDKGFFFPLHQINDLLFLDYLLNTIDREVNCFVVSDSSPDSVTVSVPGRPDSGPGKARTLRMIDNESAEFASRTQTQGKPKSSILQYNRYRVPHGYDNQRTLRYFVDSAAKSGKYDKQVCGFGKETVAKFEHYWPAEVNPHGGETEMAKRTLGDAVLAMVDTLGDDAGMLPNGVLTGVIDHEMQDVAREIDIRALELWEHVRRCPTYD